MKQKVIEFGVVLTIILGMFAIVFMVWYHSPLVYKTNKGTYLEQQCEVTEVTETIVAVNYDGEKYWYYANDPEVMVGDEIVVTFFKADGDTEWQIVATH